jgi:hypothetical protein
MRTEQFEKEAKGILEGVYRTLTAKAGQYAHGGDRLSNFRRTGRMLQCTPERALVGIMSKHTIAMCDFIDELERGHTVRPLEHWEEKLGDQMAYLVLMLCLVRERHAENPYSREATP